MNAKRERKRTKRDSNSWKMTARNKRKLIVRRQRRIKNARSKRTS